MLKIKKLLCLLSFIVLSNIYNESTISQFNVLATEVVDNKNIQIERIDNIALINNSINLQCEKFIQRALETQEKLANEMVGEKTNKPEYRQFILTFYTSLESENSSAGAVTCQNKALAPGGVANNIIPQNTKIYLEGYGQVVVNDKGSDKYFGVDNRLDVFIEREPGESDREYAHRVNSYGVQKVQGYIIK